jgi:hypothetical protein
MVGCEQVEEYLSSAGAASRCEPPPEIRAHLDTCGPCRKLWEFAGAGEPGEVSSSTRDCIVRRLGRSLTPVRPLTCRWKLTLAFLAIFAAGALLWALQSGWRGAQGMTPVQLAGTLSAVAAAAALAAVALSGEMVPGEKRFAPIGLVALFVIGGIAMLVLALFPWESSGSAWLAAAMQCHTHGAMIALPTAAAAFLLFRRGSALSPGAAGAAIGLLAGLAAMATLHLGCSMHGALHIAAGHLSVPAGAALLGYLAGKATERWAAGARRDLFEA